jgi:hypothetical protein
MRFSPIDSDPSGNFLYIVSQGFVWIFWNITIIVGSVAKKTSRLGAFIEDADKTTHGGFSSFIDLQKSPR